MRGALHQGPEHRLWASGWVTPSLPATVPAAGNELVALLATQSYFPANRRQRQQTSNSSWLENRLGLSKCLTNRYFLK